MEARQPYQYSAWDGTQEVPDFSADDILDQLADDLLRAGDPRKALRNLLQRGFTLPDGRRFDGLRRLLQQMQREREAMLDRYDPSRTIDAIREKLDEIIQMERESIESRGTNRSSTEGSDGSSTGESPSKPGEGESGREQGQAGQQTAGLPGGSEPGREQGQAGQQRAGGFADGSQSEGGRQRGSEGAGDGRSQGSQPGRSAPQQGGGRAGDGRSQGSQPGGSAPQQGSERAGDGGPQGSQPGGSAPQQGGEHAGDGGADGSGGDVRELEAMLERMLERKRSQLDQLPRDNAGRIRSLREYDFMSAEAREAFESLVGDLQRRLLQQYSQSLKDGVGQITPEMLDATRQMVQDLNQMIEASRQGDRHAFQEFMNKWGQNFPPDIETLDDLLSYLQQQASQVQALLDSMDPQSRQELLDMMSELLRDDRLQLDLAQLGANLEAMGYPIQGGGFPFEGSDAPGFGESLDMMRRLQAMEQLEEALARDPLSALSDAANNTSGLSPSSLFGRRMGAQIEAVKDMAESLLEAGYLKRNGERLELTPRAIRKLGDSALKEIFQKLKDDRQGGHQTHRRGQGGDLAAHSKPYNFGDPFHVDLRSTLMNGVRRGARSPLRLMPSDFDVFETERAVRHATVLAIDTSRSMFLRGLFLEAKKTALALDSLIRGQFPHDVLQIIGFADVAYELTRDDLPALAENYMVQGTNYEMALALSRRLLARHRGGNRQILFVTDGEPTACCVPNGGIYVNYPAPGFVRRAALTEAARCYREGIVINTFMLDADQALVSFVERMTAVNRGRAFLTGPYHLGEHVLLDYLDKRVTKKL